MYRKLGILMLAVSIVAVAAAPKAANKPLSKTQIMAAPTTCSAVKGDETAPDADETKGFLSRVMEYFFGSQDGRSPGGKASLRPFE